LNLRNGMSYRWNSSDSPHFPPWPIHHSQWWKRPTTPSTTYSMQVEVIITMNCNRLLWNSNVESSQISQNCTASPQPKVGFDSEPTLACRMQWIYYQLWSAVIGISISYRRIVITTSGFVVAMHTDRENLCWTIQNFVSVDVTSNLESTETYILTPKLHFYLVPTQKGRIYAELYRISCRSLFHRIWRARKPIFRRQNCISLSFLCVVIG
jgi:hypothetical protein